MELFNRIKDIEKHEIDTKLAHDPLHCIHCTDNKRIIQSLEIIAGLQQALLSKIDGEFGVPRGTIFQFSQLAPATNAVYTSPGAPIDGVIRSIMLSGQGNVTVALKSQSLPGGTLAIGTYALNSIPVALPFHIACPAGTTVTLTTDATAGSLISFSAWLEPSMMNGSEFFRMRR